MSLSLDWYEKIWEGSDSDVFRKKWWNHVLKIYELDIPPFMIESYHKRQKQLSKLAYKPLEPWKSSIDLCLSDEEVLFDWAIVRWMTCSILELDPDKVHFGSVDWFFWKRVVARAQYVDGNKLKSIEHNSPLIREVETRLRRTWVPIWTWLWVFAIDPINVKVLWFRDQVLDLMITDLGANIKVNMAGY